MCVNKAYKNCESSLQEARQDYHDKKYDQNKNLAEERIFISDHLALMTQLTRKLFAKFKSSVGKLQDSAFYK